MIPDKLKHKIMEVVMDKIVERAVELCPVDMGDLRKSIVRCSYINGDTIYIASDLDYAVDMEYGRPPEPLSAAEKEDVKGWAKRHKANPYGVIYSLEHKGIKVGTVENPLHITSFHRDAYRPYLRPAIHQILNEPITISPSVFK